MNKEELNSIVSNSNTPETSKEMTDGEIYSRDEFFINLVKSQCLNSMSEDEITVELVREMCYRYSLQKEWVKETVISDAKSTMVNAESINENDLWDAYLFGIQYSAVDIIRMKKSPNENERSVFDILTRDTFGPTLIAPIKGRAEIELKIINNIFRLDLQYAQNNKTFFTSLTTFWLTPEDLVDSLLPRYYRRAPQLSRNRSLGSNTTSKKFFNTFKNSNVEIQKIQIPRIELAKQKLTPEPYEVRKLKVNDRLERFVNYLVKEFEAKLLSYIMLSEREMLEDADLDALSIRIGQVCGGVVFGALGGVTGATLRLSKHRDGVEFGNKVGGIVVNTIHSKLKAGKVKSLELLIDYYQNHKSEFRRTLVEVGFDIFQSFEMQFMRVTSDTGHKKALHLLVRNLTNRIINYISRKMPEIKNLHSVLIEGVIFGKSKLDLSNFGKRGFEISYENNGQKMKWVTGSLFEKVGVIDDGQFYKIKDKKSQPLQFGYRRAFSSENPVEMSSKFDPDVKTKEFSDYEYILNVKRMKSKAKKMFQNLDEKDLEDERIENIMRETKEEMMDGIIILKGLSRDFSGDLKKLTRIEEILKNTKIEEYTSQLEAHFRKNEIKYEEMDNMVERLYQVDEKLDQILNYLFEKLGN